jgi:ABC-2 type transport system permease protein
MIQLFNGMQSSLSMVYDREMGSMRVLLTTPLPRSYLLFCRLFGSVLVSLVQAYAFLLVAYLFGIDLPTITLRLTEGGELWTLPDPVALIAVLPALILTGMLCGALGMVISSTIKQLENFAGVMNFVIFPMFFASSALYPLWRIKESSVLLYEICRFNPFTHAVELIRFALYGQVDWVSLAAVLAFTVVFLGGAIYAYNPSKGLIARRGGPGAGA